MGGKTPLYYFNIIMNNGYKAIEKIYENVIRIVDKKIAHLYSDKEAIIVSQNEYSYTVLIDSYKYNVKNGTNINFKSGDKCLVHYINGNQQRKLIIAKL